MTSNVQRLQIFLFPLFFSYMANATDLKTTGKSNLQKDEIVVMKEFSLLVPKGWSYERGEPVKDGASEKMIREWISLSLSARTSDSTVGFLASLLFKVRHINQACLQKSFACVELCIHFYS